MISYIYHFRGVKRVLSSCIIYYSKHHENTKKLIDAIKAEHAEVDLIDVTQKREQDLHGYDVIGIASGIYYGEFAEQVLNFARVNLPPQKKVFFMATCGNPMKSYFKGISKITADKQCVEVGKYLCKGFDTFGPFKLVGGIQKGHPTDEEIKSAVEFYNGIV